MFDVPFEQAFHLSRADVDRAAAATECDAYVTKLMARAARAAEHIHPPPIWPHPTLTQTPPKYMNPPRRTAHRCLLTISSPPRGPCRRTAQ